VQITAIMLFLQLGTVSYSGFFSVWNQTSVLVEVLSYSQRRRRAWEWRGQRRVFITVS